VKPNINSVEVHPQLNNNRHPVDGVLVGAGSMWPTQHCLGPPQSLLQTKSLQKKSSLLVFCSYNQPMQAKRITLLLHLFNQLAN
jgi:hypothetical protein